MPDQMNPVGGSDSEGGGPDVRTVRGFYVLAIAGDRRGIYDLVTPDEILYVFLVGAVGGTNHLKTKRIISAWVEQFDFADGKVYIRTATGLYQSNIRTLAEFRRICPLELWKANQSVLVDLDSVTGIEPTESIKKVSFEVAETDWSWEFDQVTIGRSFVPEFFENFAF